MDRKLIASTALFLTAIPFLTGAASPDTSKPFKHVVVHALLTGKDISRTTATVSDVPNHELAQRVYSYAIHSDDKDFDNMHTENFAQTDTTGGKGTHTGYAIWKNDKGDAIYVQFNGEHHPDPGAAGNAEFSGTVTVRGGSGKFGTISGKGSYLGKITPDAQTSDAALDVSY